MEKSKDYKYLTEFGISMYLENYQFIQQKELEDFAKQQAIFTDSNSYNLYFIVKRARVSLDPSFSIITPDYIELRYYIHSQDGKIERRFRLSNTFKDSMVNIKSQYPYNHFFLTSPNGLNRYCKLAALIDNIHITATNQEPELDYEVLYIGQAYGEDGKRTAIDRLVSHSTLQLIYAEAMKNNPDSEIWIMLASFGQKNITSPEGGIQTKATYDEDKNRFINFTDSKSMRFTEKQTINFTEAALIRAFQPPYNKKYKNTFPNPAHSSYSECYDLDVNSIIVEVDTSGVRRWLHSPLKLRFSSKKPEFYQDGRFFLANNEERYQMFNNDYL